jgi:hypothetical protein
LIVQSRSDRTVWLPFEDLLEQLTRKGFRIGIEHSLRLEVLLNRLGDQCSPSDLKTLLCPLFATNAHQQESFYRAFDACYPFLHSQGGESLTTAEIASETVGRGGRAARPVWLVIIASVVIALAVLTASALWRATSDRSAGTAPTASPARVVPQPEPAIPPPTAQSPWTNWYAVRRTELGWLAVGGPIAAWLAWELHRSRRRRLLIRKSQDKSPPYSWPVRADATPEIYEPSRLASVSRLLHRRYQGESERLDVMATVAASIASFGFPTFRYRRDSQLPDYLFLIDRAGFRDHQSRLYEHLATMLRAQGLYVTTWFFDGDPRVCWSPDHDSSVHLEQLARTCSHHRLLLFGTAKHLLDAVTGRFVEWYGIFESWTDRAILTPEPPSGAGNLALTAQFVVVPATLDGLRALATHFEASGSAAQGSAEEIAALPASPKDPTEDISAMRGYLGPDLFRWLCACAIYPELQWGLTLTIGALPIMPPGLVCEENLTKLLRIDWFRNGSIPDDQRAELIAQLEPRVERDVREAIIQVLDDSPVPDETIAASAHSFQIAYQRASLAPNDRHARANLKAALDDLSSHETGREHAYLDASGSQPRSALDLLLPHSLRKVFYPTGVPWMPQRMLSSFAMVFLVAAAGLEGLRLADRWVWPAHQLLTITKPAGGTIVGPGIECGTGGSRCSTSITTGHPIDLALRADKGFVFSGFTGDCAPSGRISMTEPRTCGATFSSVAGSAPPATFRLTIAKPEGGTVVGAGGILCGTNGGNCTADIPSGVPVSLRAEADDGFSLQQFTGDCPSTGEMTMTSAKTCGTAFVRSAAPINVAAGPAPMPPNPAASMGIGIAAAPPRTADEHAKREIGQLVESYCASLETLNPASIRRFVRVDNERELSASLREYKSLRCTITTPADYDRLDAGRAGGAQLKFGMKQVIEMRSGGGPQSSEAVVTMVVSRKDFQSPWLVDRVQYEFLGSISRGTSIPAIATAVDKPAVPIAPSQGGLEVIQGETDKAYKARVAAARRKYDDAVAVLASQKYVQAASLLTELMNVVPSGYLDLQQRRAEAHDGMRAQGKAALQDAQTADGRDNYDAAIELYFRAHQLDPTIQVDQLIQGVRDRKLAFGKKTCTVGLVSFALGDNTTALPALEDAVRLLPPADPCYVKAKAALQQLK